MRAPPGEGRRPQPVDLHSGRGQHPPRHTHQAGHAGVGQARRVVTGMQMSRDDAQWAAHTSLRKQDPAFRQ